MFVEATPLVPAGTIEVDGLVVPYYDSGSDHEGQLPLVIVHGTAGSTNLHFNLVYPALASNRRVISLDWQALEGVRLEVDMIVRQVLAVVDHVVPDREIALLGFSLGAVAAIATAAARPHQIRRLIPVTGWAKSDPRQALFVRVYLDLHQAGSSQVVAYTLLSAFGVPFLSRQSTEQIEMFIDMTVHGAEAAAQMDLNGRVDISDRLKHITAKTLIISGTYDSLVPLHHGAHLVESIKDAQYSEISAGHLVFVEQPEEVLNVIDRFLLSAA